jgi:hypothetical protein
MKEKIARGIQESDPLEKGGTASVTNKNAHAKDQEEEEKQMFDESSTMQSSDAFAVTTSSEESKH